MTSSGICHKCDKIANHFHYTRPRKDEFDTHEGFWHCEDHGPVVIVHNPNSVESALYSKINGTNPGPVIKDEVQFDENGKPIIFKNRAERRAYQRKNK